MDKSLSSPGKRSGSLKRGRPGAGPRGTPGGGRHAAEGAAQHGLAGAGGLLGQARSTPHAESLPPPNPHG